MTPEFTDFCFNLSGILYYVNIFTPLNPVPIPCVNFHFSGSLGSDFGANKSGTFSNVLDVSEAVTRGSSGVWSVTSDDLETEISLSSSSPSSRDQETQVNEVIKCRKHQVLDIPCNKCNLKSR